MSPDDSLPSLDGLESLQRLACHLVIIILYYNGLDDAFRLFVFGHIN